MKIICEPTLKSRATIKKLKCYDFEFNDDDLIKGKKSSYEHPHFCKEINGIVWFAMYAHEGILRIEMFHSYDIFKELRSEGK